MRVRRKTSAGIARANREGSRKNTIFLPPVAHGMVLISSHCLVMLTSPDY